MSEKLSKPVIFIQPGCCPFCIRVLKIYESEMNAITIDSNGVPKDIENEYTKTVGFCDQCGRTFTMIKEGMTYEPYSEIKSIIKEERLKRHLNKANDNPFGYNEGID